MGKPRPRFFCWFTIAGAQGHPGTAVGAWTQVWTNAASLLTASLPALCSPCTSLLPPPLAPRCSSFFLEANWMATVRKQRPGKPRAGTAASEVLRVLGRRVVFALASRCPALRQQLLGFAADKAISSKLVNAFPESSTHGHPVLGSPGGLERAWGGTRSRGHQAGLWGDKAEQGAGTLLVFICIFKENKPNERENGLGFGSACWFSRQGIPRSSAPAMLRFSACASS